MRGEFRLAAEFDALGLSVCPAPRGALGERRRSSFAATPSIARTSSAKSDVVSTTGSAIERRPAPARCMSRAITRRSVASRERRSTAGVMTTSPGARAPNRFLNCGSQVRVLPGTPDFNHLEGLGETGREFVHRVSADAVEQSHGQTGRPGRNARRSARLAPGPCRHPTR
jgi:hypothetical protein